MIKKMAIVMCVVAVLVAQSFAAVPDRVSPYRPGNPGLFYSYENLISAGGAMVGTLDKTGYHGWLGIVDAGWADFNGDGIDDKVVWQVYDTNGFQIVVVKSSSEGDISSSDWQNNGYIGTSWTWGKSAAGKHLLFADVDGDGIDDNIMATSSDNIFNDGKLFMVWTAWPSGGNAGIPNGPTTWGVAYDAFGGTQTGTPYIGDINGDGHADRIIYTKSTGKVEVDFSTATGWGDKNVDADVTFGSGNELSVADVDGDGYDDLIIWRQHATLDTYEINVYLTHPTAVWSNIVPGTPNYTAQAGFPSLSDVIRFARLDPGTELVWSDGFNTSGSSLDINYQYTLRQTGVLAPDAYVANSVDEPSDYHEQIVSNGAGSLLLAGDGFGTAPVPVLVSPNQNFKGLSPEGNVVGSKITFNLDVFGDPANNSYTQAGITIGASAPLTACQTANGGFGIRFVEDWFGTDSCFLQFYDGDQIVANGVTNPAGSGWATVTIKVYDPLGGSPWDGFGSTAIDVYVNGQLVFGYNKQNGGYTNNYITLEGSANLNNWGLASNYFDNLKVWAEAAAPVTLKADLNDDGIVNLKDFGLFAAHWLATGHSIKNPSFENDVVADGSTLPVSGGSSQSSLPTNVPQYWTINPSIVGDVINPLSSVTLQPTDGNNYVFLSGGGGNIAQFVGGYCTQYKLEPNAVYTVKVDVAVDSTWNPSLGDWYKVELLALHDNCAGTFSGIDNLVIKTHITNPPVENEWTTVTLTVDMADFPQWANGGSILLLDLQGSGVYYDNLRFFSTVFPDFNNDDIINFEDFMVFADEWLQGI